MIGRVFLGRYQTTRLLGEGGMGRVYLARQLDLGRQVVVKVMHDHTASDAKFCERFQRETLLMARFQHPYAVTLYDASLDDPLGPCIVMEHIRGMSLDELLKRNGRLSAARVGRLLGQLCEVLQAAHAQGIIHRDLKPANLMVVDPDTPYEKIKVMDFGLATLLGPEKGTVPQKKGSDPLNSGGQTPCSDSNTEFAVGTPGYMCPEQIRGEETDQRGDLYSVGVIVYELLSGKLPFGDRSSMDVMLAHVTEEPAAFAEIGADWVSPELEAVVRSCLAKDPAQRPACARNLAELFQTALEEEQAGFSSATPQSVPEPGCAPGVIGPAKVADPCALIHELDAWLPERIATCKLRGFVQDAGGEVIECIPGRIRVRLGGHGSAYTPPGRGPLSWIGLGRKAGQIEMELDLQQAGAARQNVLHVTVSMRPFKGGSVHDDEWRARANQIYCDLRGYLLGQPGSIAQSP